MKNTLQNFLCLRKPDKRTYHRIPACRNFTRKCLGIMKYTAVIILSFCMQVSATAFSQKVSLNARNARLENIFNQIRQQTGYNFLYKNEVLETARPVTVSVRSRHLPEVLNELFRDQGLTYDILDKTILVKRRQPASHRVLEEIEVEELPGPAILQQTQNSPFIPFKEKFEESRLRDITVRGKVTDEKGDPLPGVNILLKGTQKGSTTGTDGRFEIEAPGPESVLTFSFVGYVSQDITIGNRTSLEISMAEDQKALEEVMVVGYGTARKSDLTGSVVRADIEAFRESPNVSILQSLQGSVAGLNIGQVNKAGAEPAMEIRGRTSLSGELRPLIVIDGVIYRGDLNNINPNDIESVDILKDASAAAVYGSQASNGVILLTTKKGRQTGKPVINYSSSYTFQSPVKEFKTGTAEDYLYKTELSDLRNSRTQQSGYLERRPGWDPSTKFKTSDEILAYNQGRSENWYALITNPNPSHSKSQSGAFKLIGLEQLLHINGVYRSDRIPEERRLSKDQRQGQSRHQGDQLAECRGPDDRIQKQIPGPDAFFRVALPVSVCHAV